MGDTSAGVLRDRRAALKREISERLAELQQVEDDLFQAVIVNHEPSPETTPYGVRILPKGVQYHPPEVCAASSLPCVFHKPSDHHMREWPIMIRLDRFGSLAERLCPHGVGHPDPDSLAYVESLHKPSERGYEGVHGCDRCCQTGTPAPAIDPPRQGAAL